MGPAGGAAGRGRPPPGEAVFRGGGPTRRDSLHRATAAPGRHRGLDGGAARRPRDPRLHDRDWPSQAARGGVVMNGVHDMGGMQGFGKVEPEKDEPPFHAGWEGRVLAMQRAMTFTGEW